MASFPVTGALVGYTVTPALAYQDNAGNWLPLPVGATVTSTGFSFTHPDIPVAGNYTVSVRDVHAPAVVGKSPSFSVAAAALTTLHYAANGNFDGASNYALTPYGFNLADLSSVSELDGLPAGVKGLVFTGYAGGADATFQNMISPFIGHPKLYGFYLFDEPDPTGQFNTLVPVANMKAQSDWVHAHVPGAVTFLAMMNMGSDQNPSYVNTYNPANTGIDLYGLDPYPVRAQNPGGVDYTVIPAAVNAAIAWGIPLPQIVPVFQAFGGGGYPSWTMPTATQATQILATWKTVVPNPVFDYVYSWGSQLGDFSLSTSPSLQTVYSAHNFGTTPLPPSGVPAYDHIVLVMMENHDYVDIIGNVAQAPYINNTLAANGAVFTNYQNIIHPSQGNYFALYAGTTFGVTDDNVRSEPDPTIATVMKGAGLSIVCYFESGNDFDQIHCPWLSFPEGSSVAQDFTGFPTNYALLPRFSWITPNLIDDMHNGTIPQGDTWLASNIEAYRQWAVTHNSLLIMCFDESEATNNLLCIMSGAHIVPGKYGQSVNHLNLCRTFMAAFGLTAPNDAATASIIGGGVFS